MQSGRTVLSFVALAAAGLLAVLLYSDHSAPTARASQNAVCADAVLTFTGTGTLVNYLPPTPANVTINFGRTFNVADIKIVQIYIKFGPTNLFDGGEGWFMPNYGGQGNSDGSQSSAFLQQLQPSVIADFADGLFVTPLNAESNPPFGPGPASFEVIAVRGCVIESVGPGQKTPTLTGTATGTRVAPTNTSTPTTVIVQPTSTPVGTVVAQGTNTPTRTMGPSLGGVAGYPDLSSGHGAEAVAAGVVAAGLAFVGGATVALRRRMR